MTARRLLASLLVAILAGCAVRPKPETGAMLAGTTWSLVEFRSSDDATGVVRPAEGREFTMTFGMDGRVTMRLDCNRATGGFTATPGAGEGGSLTFSPLAMTRAFCGEQSMDTRIARDAEFVRTYLRREGRLYIDLMADGGTYVWEER
jgi:heat shock protein HslJ